MFGNAKHFLILFIRLHKTWAAFLQLNSFRTSWFPSQFGVKQGDVLSRNLFALHVTDLAQEIKQVDICIWNDDVNLSVNDILLVAEKEKKNAQYNESME